MSSATLITYQETLDKLLTLPKYNLPCSNTGCQTINCIDHCVKCGVINCEQHNINFVQFSNIRYDEKNTCFTQNIHLSCGNFIIYGAIKFINVAAYPGKPFTPISMHSFHGTDLYDSIMTAFISNKNIDKIQNKSISEYIDNGFKHFDKTFGNSLFTNVRPVKATSTVCISYGDNKYISFKFNEFINKFYSLYNTTENVDHIYAVLTPKTINYKINHNLNTITSEIKLEAAISILADDHKTGVPGRFQ